LAHGLYARFLARRRGDLEAADRHYREAVAAGMHDPRWVGEYARFLERELRDPSRARRFYERAVAAEPTPEVVVDYARFLELTHGDEAKAEEEFRRAIELAPGDVYPARQYARFLEDTRGDADAAEAQYLRALSIAPSDPLTLGWFGRFLERRRGDDLRAAHYYLQAARAEPARAYRWATVVRFLVRRELFEEAHGSLRRWLERAEPGDDLAPRAEALFYGLVYLPEGERGACFERLKALLAENAPLGRWDPEAHIAHARAEGRADAPWVARLARVIRERMG